MNHATVELFIKDLELPEDALVGEEGKGFSYILDGMNAERILIAAECVGDGHWFIERASAYARERIVFDRPIGQNQGVQFPLARAHAAVCGGRADDAATRPSCSRPASPAGPRPTWPSCWPRRRPGRPANACLNTHGGFGFAEEYDVERKFRENRLYMSAPIHNNLILAYLGQHVLGMPKSY